MSETDEPGDTAPKTVKVRSTQHPEVTDNVTAGEIFPPCMHRGEHHGKVCTSEYG